MIARIRSYVPLAYRDRAYRYVNAVTILLLVAGYVTSTNAALWGGLVTGLITLVFALLYATSTWRAALYAVTGPVGAVLLAYGIVDDVRWTLLVTATGYVLGITTAAARTTTVPTLQR